MIQKATEKDLDTLAGLALLMWNTHTLPELREEFLDSMRRGNTVFFLLRLDSKPVGFAQCSLRHDYVEGTAGSPVGYLEGIFVKEGYRHKGYAKTLLKECELWAVQNGCSEFASDCEIENAASLQFHLRTGFKEANRIVCFTKKL